MTDPAQARERIATELSHLRALGVALNDMSPNLAEKVWDCVNTLDLLTAQASSGEASQRFHDDRCYSIGAGDTEALICKWRKEGGLFGRREAADELEALSRESAALRAKLEAAEQALRDLIATWRADAVSEQRVSFCADDLDKVLALMSRGEG